MASAFYIPDGEGFMSTEYTRGPWDPRYQHAGPPAALMARAIEHLDDGEGFSVSRFTIEVLRSIRVGPRGIYPPLLAEKGLPTALQAQARKATLPVTIEADGVGRYSQDTEAALCLCTLEALQNIQKYASATHAVVRLREDGDNFSVEVVDDGRGFDVATTSRGNGLTNMEDRLDALGGTLHMLSSPGNGTTLRAAVPAHHTSSITT